jgi:hypothetical protein
MDTSIGFFDKVGRVGAIILETLGPSVNNYMVIAYLDKVEDIYNLLMKIHDEVVEVVIKTDYAKTVDDIKTTLQEVGHDSLKDTFKANKWCDQLQELGIALRPLSIDANLLGSDREIWDEFCTALEQREDEVAKLYYEELLDLRDLPNKVTDVVLLKQMLNNIATQLVTQKAKFDLLAKRARSMRNHLNPN